MRNEFGKFQHNVFVFQFRKPFFNLTKEQLLKSLTYHTTYCFVCVSTTIKYFSPKKCQETQTECGKTLKLKINVKHHKRLFTNQFHLKSNLFFVQKNPYLLCVNRSTHINESFFNILSGKTSRLFLVKSVKYGF